MRIVIDADDAAFNLKKELVAHLQSKDIDVEDLDYNGTKADATYPEVGYNLALKVQAEKLDRAILICGTGLGMAMIANKVEGVYAGVCHDVYSAERLRASNNAQVLTMGERVVGVELAKTIVDAWLKAEYQGGRSAPKVDIMRQLENESFKK
ncbi:MAG: RpiB/LacA/LacB family sugar-phosphate isomerase [Bacteroides sp.]|nr:RpiB/LacA/LacB family sugar-phosphate isomerase [Bacteroides sp.]